MHRTRRMDPHSERQVNQSKSFSTNDKAKQILNCSFCDFECIGNAKMQTHLHKHTGEKPFKCKLCHYQCRLKVCLVHHMRKHNNEKSFKCDQCDAAFVRKTHLLRHLKTHSDERPYKCQLCDFASRFNSSLVVHKMTHAGYKSYKCNFCDNIFRTKGSLMCHMSVHTGDRKFKCDVCDYSCNHKVRLESHRRQHTGEKPFKCQLCDLAFTGSVNLKYHMISHSDEKTFKCNNCDKTFKFRHSLTRHAHLHSDPQMKNRPHKCDVCGCVFRFKTELYEHRKTHVHTTKWKYKCEICLYVSRTEKNLVSHMKLHVDNKPYKCTFCDYACRQPFSLKTHVRARHTKERPYKCNQCDSSFVVKSQLSTHLTTHTDEKPFKCDKCDFSTKRKAGLNKHKKRIHGRENLYQCNKCDYSCYLQREIENHTWVHITENNAVGLFADSSASFKINLNHPKIEANMPQDNTAESASDSEANLFTTIKLPDDKPFKCKGCNYAGKAKRYLNRHLKKYKECRTAAGNEVHADEITTTIQSERPKTEDGLKVFKAENITENHQTVIQTIHPADISNRRESQGNISIESQVSVSVKQEPITEEFTPQELRNMTEERINTGPTKLNVLADVKKENDDDVATVGNEQNRNGDHGNRSGTSPSSHGPWVVYVNETQPIGMVVGSEPQFVSIKEECPSDFPQISQTSLDIGDKYERINTPQTLTEKIKEEPDVD